MQEGRSSPALWEARLQLDVRGDLLSIAAWKHAWYPWDADINSQIPGTAAAGGCF